MGARERLPVGRVESARGRRGAGISRCCSGCARTARRGTVIRARSRRGAGTSRCCSGCARTAARGTQPRARMRRRAGTSRCCSGRAPTAARRLRARGRRWADISRCCSGRARTAAQSGEETRTKTPFTPMTRVLSCFITKINPQTAIEKPARASPRAGAPLSKQLTLRTRVSAVLRSKPRSRR